MPAPVGELTTLGIAKEIGFATPAPPTIFHENEAFTPSSKNTMIARVGSAGRPGQSYPTTGPIDISMSFRPASAPDTLVQMIKYAMGTEFVTANPAKANPLSSVTTTITTLAPVGSTTLVLGTSAGVAMGVKAYLDTGTVQEIVTFTNSSGAITAPTQFSHNVGATVVSFRACDHSFTFGNLLALPSFTAEFNRITDAVDYVGCSVDTMKLALDVGKGLQADFSLVAANLALNASPTAPSFSNKSLFAMEAAATATIINTTQIGPGAVAAGQVAVMKYDIMLANNLNKNYRGAGNSRQVLGFPLGQRKVSGSMSLGFENDAILKSFFGGNAGPGSVVSGIPLTFVIGNQDLVNPAINYAMVIYLPNCLIEAADVPNVTSGPLMVPVTFSAYESVRGAGDDLSIKITNAGPSPY